MSLVRLNHAEVAFGARPLLRDANLVLEPGEKVALVGRNGAGKSTLLRVLAGTQPLDDGTRTTMDGLTIAALDQTPAPPGEETIYHLVVRGLGELGALLDGYHALTQAAAPELDRLARLGARIEALGGWSVEHRVNGILDRMALPADRRLADCSGGMQRRALLAQTLVSEPDLLLLDEPTNHLDIPAIDALQDLLVSMRSTVVVVTHDRALIDRVATRIVEVDRGRLSSFPGNYATYVARREKAAEDEAGSARKFDRELAQEEEWIRQGIKARRTRNEGRVRRLERMRLERAGRLERQGNARMAIDASTQSGALVAELEDVTFGFETPLIRNFSTRIQRGDRVGILGPNGAGKSTLLRLILGELAPHSGRATLGTRLEIAYFDQQRQRLDETATVRENVADGTDQVVVAGKRRHVVGYLQDFLFPPTQLNSPVASLSGGERNRLLLARLFSKPANLLVLDEPTNDLDVETLELLEELLSEFEGTLLLVSHDRAFLDAVVTSTIVFEGGGNLREYVGGYSAWLEQTRARENALLAERAATVAPAPAAASPMREESRDRRAGNLAKRELASLPERIEALEARHARLQQDINDPGFYQRDPVAMRATLDELTELTAAIDAAYARWQALTDLGE